MTANPLALLLITGISILSGCRACSSCYDYSPPVAAETCGTCGTGRAGSVLSGVADVPVETTYLESSPPETPARD